MLNKRYITPLILLLLSTTIQATHLNVAKAYPNIIRVPSDQPTIQRAIDSAKPGDTIIVSPGTYNEHLHINRSGLSIIGENPEKTIIIGENPVIRVAICTHVTVANVTIKGAGNPMGADLNGIFVYKASYITIANVTIIDNEYAGILLRQSNYTLIENCLIKNNKFGLWIEPSSLNNAVIYNNFINNSISCIIYPSTSVFYNYWDDYHGTDANGDGIGDSPYYGRHGCLGVDECPLMEPWTLSKLTKKFPVGTYNVTVYSNAIISALNYSQSLKEISFNIKGPSTPSRLTFFCKVYMPKALL
jgi:parallel beta-helix repeat protein